MCEADPEGACFISLDTELLLDGFDKPLTDFLVAVVWEYC